MNKSIKKVAAFLKNMLQQGMSPGKIALSVSLGGTLGLFPLPGVSTLLCGVVALSLRLNQAVIQAANYAVYPLQLLLMGFYFALGSQWFGDPGSMESFSGMVALLRDDLWEGLLALKQLGLYAVVVWLLTSPILTIALYFLIRFAARRIQGTLKKNKDVAVEYKKDQSGTIVSPTQDRLRPENLSDEAWQASQQLHCSNCVV